MTKRSFFPEDSSTSIEYDILMRHNLKSAALYYLDRNASPTERAAKVFYECYRCLAPMAAENGLPAQKIKLPPYDDHIPWYKPLSPDPELLEPWIDGDEGKRWGLYVGYCGRVVCDWEKLAPILEQYEPGSVEYALFRDIHMDSKVQLNPTPARYYHMGMHRVMDTEAILNGGYTGRIAELEKEMEGADAEKRSFLRGLLYTAEAIMEYLARCAAHYRAAADGDPSLMRLADALDHAPANPCASFYEGVLVVRLMTLLVFSEHGRIDQLLYPLYKRDREAGRIRREEAASLLDDLFRHINETAKKVTGIMWHTVIGGCDREGRPAYNDLTRIVLENVGRYAQPHISLRVSRDMPEDIWRLALEKIGAGAANPSLVNEEVYIKDLIEGYGVAPRDARDFAFGGCSETLVPGATCVDSTWTAFNVLDVLNACVYRHLTGCGDYAAFYEIFRGELSYAARELAGHINLRQHAPAAFVADPLSTLHTGGCIASGKTYLGGGARYNFDSANIYGLTNAINALAAIKACYEGKLAFTPKELLLALKDNYESRPDILAAIRKLPKFGNGDAEVGEIAVDLSNLLFDEIRAQRCYRGNGRFMPCVVVLNAYVPLGAWLGASADGRKSGDPLCDSCGPSAGTDREGPTVMMADAARLPHAKGAGTLVLNVMLSPDCFSTAEKADKISTLFRGYFAMGGTQLQVTVADEKLLLDAFERPERHGNILVRVGGFSDYFTHQSKAVQKTILLRTGHKI